MSTTQIKIKNAKEETGVNESAESGSRSSRSRSRSRSPAVVGITPTWEMPKQQSKKKAKAAKVAKKRAAEMEKERSKLLGKENEEKSRKDKSEREERWKSLSVDKDECINMSWKVRDRESVKRKIDGKEIVGLDRVKGGMKEVYVVCENITGPIRQIKKECMDDEVMKGLGIVDMMDDSGKENSGDESGKGAKQRRVERDEPEEATEVALTEMRSVTRNLRRLLLSDANKVTRYVADKVLDQCSLYEGVLQRLALENARLRGCLQACETINTKVERVCSNVESLKNGMNEMNESYVRMHEKMYRGMPGNIPDNAKELVKDSYAVILRGKNEELTTKEVQKRLAEEISREMDVRIRAVRPTRNGGLMVQTPSASEKEALANCPGLAQAGLRAEEPKTPRPRVLLNDVPCRLTAEELLRGIYEKNMKDLVDEETFMKCVSITKRIERRGSETGNVIIEVPEEGYKRLLKQGRAYVRWESFKCTPFVNIMRCFKCLKYGHLMRVCASDRLCWRCGRSGHNSTSCQQLEDCGNCRERKLPSGHSAISPHCPVYQTRMRMLKQRLDG